MCVRHIAASLEIHTVNVALVDIHITFEPNALVSGIKENWAPAAWVGTAVNKECNLCNAISRGYPKQNRCLPWNPWWKQLLWRVSCTMALRVSIAPRSKSKQSANILASLVLRSELKSSNHKRGLPVKRLRKACRTSSCPWCVRTLPTIVDTFLSLLTTAKKTLVQDGMTETNSVWWSCQYRSKSQGYNASVAYRVR